MAAFTPQPQNITYSAPSSETLTHFSSHTWLAPLLADNSLTPIGTFSRQPKTSSTEDSFISRTLSTPTTIPFWQSYYRPPQKPTKETPRTTTSSAPAPTTGTALSLLSLSTGLDGHPSIAHGGLLSALLDEAMAIVAYIHLPAGKDVYTAYINVRFVRPVETPGAVVLRAWIEERSAGRKMWVRACVEGEGGVSVEGAGLFIVRDRAGSAVGGGAIKAKL
ncbi:hypothetical protein FGG08_003717 [Glutinoglossum americanum]|uniref:Thioesterase domain-containing protein n=1 Tax=Glutinoglossum americanum TaxID=1670608 RepID=A0A9P8ICS3_9PEZI|nr:hypothetical protein FGG08_003717 [Glutinoglossum americanum]